MQPQDRRLRLHLVVVCVALFPAPFVRAQEKAAPTSTKGGAAVERAASAAELQAPAQPAIDKGLKFLATRQQEDGSFAASGYGRNAAVVALAGMAWLAGGSTPDRGPYGVEVGRVADYLLDHTGESGFISVEGAMSHGPMYEHGFATLF